MKPEFLIDLSQRIIPEKEHFRCRTWVDDVTKILPHVKHRPEIWYILGEIDMCTHVGTHIEVPYHHWKEGQDTADFPVHKLIAPCVVLDFHHKKNGETMTLEEVQAVARDRIKPGDMVFIRQDMDKEFFTDKWNDQAHLSIEANKWLVAQGISVLGTDATGLEVPGTDYQPNHIDCCSKGVPMIESLTNLDKLGDERHLCIVLPLPVVGLDASPLRVVAIKKGGLDWE